MKLSQAQTAARVLGLDKLDAELLLLQVLGRHHDRAWLIAHDNDSLPEQAWLDFERLCKRRAAGEPLAYLSGEKEFFGLSLQVDARVLIPRPETETLVDWALALPLPEKARVIDLGTGSGAIALALKHARPQWQVSAVDACPQALALARANAKRLALSIDCLQGHWLDGLSGPFDLIVSNPPYIALDDPHLPALRFEPALALTAGSQGLDALSVLAAQAPARMAAGGWLLLEHGHDQAQAVGQLLRGAGFQQVQNRTDLAGIERCTGGLWAGPAKPAQ